MTSVGIAAALRRGPRRLRRPAGPSGITAIIVKELRGRMRGRRAFVVVSIHILLLAGFAWMLERIAEDRMAFSGGFGNPVNFASASIGRSVFLGLMLLQTLIVAVLAPASTAGAISSEREHQTLDLLSVTPISSIAIVLGKMLSALAWVFVLILASIPITGLVFMFGGVAPDDMVRGYLVLVATAIGLGSVGIFFSALTRRTGAATGLTYVVTLGLSIGTLFVWVFLASTAETTFTGSRKHPPEAILYLNPFVAQLDVSCGAEGGLGDSCGIVSSILGSSVVQPPDVVPGQPVPAPFPGGGVTGGIGIGGSGVVIAKDAPVRLDPTTIAKLKNGGIAVDDVVLSTDTLRDRFWPKSAIALLALAVVMTLGSVQFVSPTRRWRPSLPGRARRLVRRRST